MKEEREEGKVEGGFRKRKKEEGREMLKEGRKREREK